MSLQPCRDSTDTEDYHIPAVRLAVLSDQNLQRLDKVMQTLLPAHRRHRLVDLPETSLVYKESFRMPRMHRETLS